MTLLDKMSLAVDRVGDRLQRTIAALNAAGVSYALVGESAVSMWVATVDESAVRNTKDVEILLRPADLDAVATCMLRFGFIRADDTENGIFLDGPTAKRHDIVRIILTNELTPDVANSVKINCVSVIQLEPLVRMLLSKFRNLEAMLLRDLLDIGLIDQTWTLRYQPELSARLQHLIDTPES